MCELEKPRVNEIAEPLALTVCKLELRGKTIVLRSSFKRTRISRGQQRTKRKEVPQRGFKKALVLDNEESDDDLLTADTSRDEAQTASLFES